MSSIIEGYNYDIFISYRQKDNKGDKWVSKFVDALKTELEATFKEDVSMYFDENPHDRLQETHNVDKSLEGKLKCLIFIPILSQTYCDPKSYAWQHEFLAFLQMVKGDHYGKDIRLRGGNVASRILPVRIHDLEQEDVKLFEKETGSVLRAMDFVFKTGTGAIRPLLPNEDHPNDNLYKTFYRDQISKVAIAIKEIVLGMKTEPVPVLKEKDQPRESVKESREDERKIDPEKPAKTGKSKLLSALAVLAILIVAGILAYPKIFKRNSLEKLRSSGERISVAVMPFLNMTNDTIWNVWQDGIQNELISSLTNTEELKIRQIESITGLLQNKGLTNYVSITPVIAITISQKLDADVFIYGSIKQVGASLRVNAQLIDTKTEETFKSFQIDGVAENILDIVDSLSLEIKSFLVISELQKEASINLIPFEYTGSPEAYRCFIYASKDFMKSNYPAAIKLLQQALDIDSNFYYAEAFIAIAYGNMGLNEQAKKATMEFVGKRDLLPLRQKIMADWLYSIYYETPYKEIEYIIQILEIDDQQPNWLYELGRAYNETHQYDNAIQVLERALEIYKKWESKPMWNNNYIILGNAYHKTGQYRKEKKLYKKAEQDFPDNPAIIYRQAILTLSKSKGDTDGASSYIEKYISLRKERSASEAGIATSLAGIYSEAGVMKKAEEYYRKALSLGPENPNRLNNLAWFLIDKDRNINEGLELTEKALVLSPDDYTLYDTKGWGLYKQGKYREALVLIEKAWNLKPRYDHEVYLHLEAAKKAVDSPKNN